MPEVIRMRYSKQWHRAWAHPGRTTAGFQADVETACGLFTWSVVCEIRKGEVTCKNCLKKGESNHA